jgi:secondary thiamine-phosphate synthase enzyme
MYEFSVKTESRTQMVDITDQVQDAVSAGDVAEGFCMVFVSHTTAGLTINENADPAVCQDILEEMNRLVPFQNGYAHLEGNSAAHIKSSLFGCSCMAPIEDLRLVLGLWQGIYLCEFDGPRTRTVRVVCK